MSSSLPLHETLLALLGSVALTFLVVRLLITGLVRSYKYLFCYLIVILAQTLEPFYIRFETNLYGWVYLATEWVSIFLYALIVFELYSIVLRDLKGIAKLAYRFTAVALTASILIDFLIRNVLRRPGNVIEQFFYFEFPVLSSLVVFMFLITAFLVYYPVPLHRNALVYAAGYATCFLSKAATHFMIIFSASALLRASSAVLMAITTSCYVFWAICLNREGERRAMTFGHRWSSSAARDEVLRGLRQFDESLLRSSPK